MKSICKTWRNLWQCAGMALLAVAPCAAAVSEPFRVERSWQFDEASDREGWAVPAQLRGSVQGGALWITLTNYESDEAKLFQKGNEAGAREILSPPGLDIPASKVNQIILRVLNLSPSTDYLVRWKTAETKWGPETWRKGRFLNGLMDLPPQSQRCTMKPDSKQWQELTCPIDGHWHGTLDQVAIQFLPWTLNRGDIWIAEVGIVAGDSQRPSATPDIAGPGIHPQIEVPGLSPDTLDRAMEVLKKGLVKEIPIYGFIHPVISPGGYYREGGWWLLDSGETLNATKWTNQSFSEDVMRGFANEQAQNPDGHIDGGGKDFPGRGSPSASSQLPRIFETAFDVARRSRDQGLRLEIYTMMRDYLNWWLSPVKRDRTSGLVWSGFEETFGEVDHSDPTGATQLKPREVAAVDTNVAVAIGAYRISELASALGRTDEALRYAQAFQEIRDAINRYMWNESDGVYYNFDLKSRLQRKRLIVATFDPLRIGIASATHRDRLLARLLDPRQFNWTKLPLTSVAMTDPAFVEARGAFDGRGWVGDVWPMRNAMVVKGLEEAGRPDLAAELNWKSLNAFRTNFREYFLPSTGEGEGAEDYCWTAALVISGIIDHLFGIDFDATKQRVRISPHVPKALYNQTIVLNNLILPSEDVTRLSVSILQHSPTNATIKVVVSGALPHEVIEIAMPGNDKVVSMRRERSLVATFP